MIILRIYYQEYNLCKSVQKCFVSRVLPYIRLLWLRWPSPTVLACLNFCFTIGHPLLAKLRDLTFKQLQLRSYGRAQQYHSNAQCVLCSVYFSAQPNKLALGDRYRNFYRMLNNAKKTIHSIFNSKKFQPYSFKILFI